MNGISFRDILNLFCCPPRPAQIVAKLAFLPPNPTYSIIHNETNTISIEFKSDACWQMGDCYKNKINVFQTETSRRSRIVCYYIPVDDPSAYSILFSHGNAVDLGLMAGFLQALSIRFNVNVLCYDYSGYGVSTGDPLEVNVYADAEAALNELLERFKVPLNRIVLYGQSIGTAPTVHLATRHNVAGVILHSPLMSGIRVVCPGTNRSFCFDPFTNIDKVARIKSPTLVIHGTEDEIIDISHGKQLHERLEHPVDPAWIDGAGHNDIEMFGEYADRLRKFFEDELPELERKRKHQHDYVENASPDNKYHSSNNTPPLKSSGVVPHINTDLNYKSTDNSTSGISSPASSTNSRLNSSLNERQSPTGSAHNQPVNGIPTDLTNAHASGDENK